jgi:polyhydroxyalkanoate synthesis regulator phasin
MGIFSEIRRLLWVKKAVAESAADKVAEKGREFGEKLSDKASDTWNRGREKTDDIVGKNKEKEKDSDLWVQKEDWTQSNPVKSTGESTTNRTDSTAHKVGEKLGDAAGKIGDAAEKTWDKAKEEGKELIDKAVKTSDKLWEKAEDVSEDLWTKAKDVAGKAGEKFQEGVDSMLEKAKDLDKKIEEETDKIDPNRDGWADKPLNQKLREQESTLKNKDDFFERADRFAEGDYSMGKPVVIKKETEDEPSEEGMTPLPPLPKEDTVDDAIIDEGDEPKDKA